MLGDCGRFEDIYWQQEVTESYNRGHLKTGEWVLRSRADAMHGGGAAGTPSVQDVIGAGIYRSKARTIEGDTGKQITIDHAMLTGEKFTESYEASFKEKMRGGAREASKRSRRASCARWGRTRQRR